MLIKYHFVLFLCKYFLHDIKNFIIEIVVIEIEGYKFISAFALLRTTLLKY